MGASISQELDSMIGRIRGYSRDDAFSMRELQGIRARLRQAEEETWLAVCHVRMGELERNLAAAGASDGGGGSDG